jgi:hypothetical protein
MLPCHRQRFTDLIGAGYRSAEKHAAAAGPDVESRGLQQ